MATNEYLDEERVKLWKEVDDLKKALSNAVEKLSAADQANAKRIDDASTTIQQNLEAVKSVAEAKTPEDVMTARRAAQDAVLAKEEIKKILDEAADLKGDLPLAKKAFKAIKDRDSVSEASAAQIETNRQKIETAVTGVDGVVEAVNAKKIDVESKATAALNAANAATSNAQEVANLKAKASAEFAELSALKGTIEELRDSLSELKESFHSEMKGASEKLNGLHSEYIGKLGNFYGECETRYANLEKQINGLLPGATSVALATAFDERKQAVQKAKWWWVGLLIASAGFIATFGWWSLAHYTQTQALSALPLRLVIIAAFVILEEFARRNYNITTRLAEAYAYKEAIAKSYLGFKKELDGIKTPDNSEGEGSDSVSVLAKTFLDKLADEPGKRVFDKERRAVTLLQAMTQMGGGDSGTSSVDKEKVTAALATVCMRVSWPLVVLVSILAAVGCFVAYLYAR